MESADEIIAQICHIKDQYEAQVTGQYKQWPLAIKDRVKALAESGMKTKIVAERTGISYHTVISWLHGPYKKTFRELTVVDKKSVAVTKKSTAVTATKKSRAVTDVQKSVTVKTPDGFLISAQSMSDVLLIVSQLRRER